MKEALARAKLAFEKDEVPIGAVVVKNNEIIGYGQNRTIEKNSVFAHAEVEAINMASKKEQNYRLIGCDIIRLSSLATYAQRQLLLQE